MHNNLPPIRVLLQPCSKGALTSIPAPMLPIFFLKFVVFQDQQHCAPNIIETQTTAGMLAVFPNKSALSKTLLVYFVELSSVFSRLALVHLNSFWLFFSLLNTMQSTLRTQTNYPVTWFKNNFLYSIYWNIKMEEVFC